MFLAQAPAARVQAQAHPVRVQVRPAPAQVPRRSVIIVEIEIKDMEGSDGGATTRTTQKDLMQDCKELWPNKDASSALLAKKWTKVPKRVWTG